MNAKELQAEIDARIARLAPQLQEIEALLRRVHEEFRRECSDADVILRLLGLDPVNCRTDGGSLKLVMIAAMLKARRPRP